MVSVERVLEFGDLVCEAPLELDFDKSLYPSWPHNGAVEVRGLSVRYRPSLPLALDGSTFSIPAGCRIGVVGIYRQMFLPIMIECLDLTFIYCFRWEEPVVENQHWYKRFSVS